MTNINEAIILCGGKSTRFGETNKLYCPIYKSYTLPELIILFCVQNEIKNINITINKDDLYFNRNSIIVNPIIENISLLIKNKKLEDKVNVKYIFQNENEYGPAAAIKPWIKPGDFTLDGKIYSNNVNNNFIVLFGDNFYNGFLPKFDFESVDAYASYRMFDVNPRNLKYAAIIDDFIVEKPHAFLEGNFFCGYTVFSKRVIEDGNIEKIKISGRNEYEISDFFNTSEKRKIIFNNLTWSDITVNEDINKVNKLIEKCIK